MIRMLFAMPVAIASAISTALSEKKLMRKQTVP